MDDQHGDQRDLTNAPQRRSWRRSVGLGVGIIVALITFAFAFHTTDVDLDEIRDETRRASLVRILRALAHPNLVTYDNEAFVVSAPLAMPCPSGTAVPDPDTSQGAYLVLAPSCIESGGTATVDGFGFEPLSTGVISFVPVSDFAIHLDLAAFEPDASGRFTVIVELPDGRDSDDLQAIETVTRTQVGSWTNRVEVWTDTNLNDQRDLGAVPEQMGGYGTVSVDSPGFPIRNPGAVVLVDPGGTVVEFISFGGQFTATSGLVQFSLSEDVGVEGTAFLRTGEGLQSADFAWAAVVDPTPGAPNDGQTFVAGSPDEGSSIYLNEFDVGADSAFFEIAAPGGTDLAGWKLIFYDAADGRNYRSLAIQDQVQLSPRISDNAKETWDKIIETVMLALLATVAGLLLAVPLSFLAARNLMRDVSTPILNLALNILAVPVGLVIGALGAGWAQSISDRFDNGAVIVAAVVALSLVIWVLVRRAVQIDDDEAPSPLERAISGGTLALVGILTILALYLFGSLLVIVGEALEAPLGSFGFLGTFFATIGEILEVGLGLISTLVAAAVVVTLASRLSYLIRWKWPQTARSLSYPLAALAGGLVLATIGAVINWFGQFENATATFWIPAIVGAVLGLVLAYRVRDQDSVGTGLLIYYISRTVFNGIRSIEPLVMVIVFVVWVGIGPFAGSLALALHTTAALAKLYSEQVESISSGPIEAIRATGATRVQTIVYGVVPQIIPPYISFTMYRWDINVRMSTIIGFAGGGGIGFLLQQNTGLLQYKDASVQMLAIAIVVASMDYISSRLRERFV